MLEELEHPMLEGVRNKFDINVSEVLDIVRSQNPDLDKFKKVSISNSQFIVDSISDIFKDDITDIIGNISELDKEDSGGKYCFKLVKDDLDRKSVV